MQDVEPYLRHRPTPPNRGPEEILRRPGMSHEPPHRPMGAAPALTQPALLATCCRALVPTGIKWLPYHGLVLALCVYGWVGVCLCVWVIVPKVLKIPQQKRMWQLVLGNEEVEKQSPETLGKRRP